jgi:hypothetical protein
MLSDATPAQSYDRRPNPMTPTVKWALGLGAAALAVGGVVWLSRGATASAKARGESPPSPWAPVDAKIAADAAKGGFSLDDVRIAAQGSGTTRSGMPYLYRVYELVGTQSQDPFMTTVLYQLPSGAWEQWKAEDGPWVATPSVADAESVVREWAEHE